MKQNEPIICKGVVGYEKEKGIGISTCGCHSVGRLRQSSCRNCGKYGCGKGNQGRLNKAFEEKFPLKELNNPEHDSYAMSEKSHGREEIRLHIVCDVPDELIDFTFEWKGLKKLCVAVSFRSIIAEQKKELEMTVRYYISSADLTAEKFATAIRNHWHVENKLHRRLDVVMNEDDYKIRRGNAAELFSGIRHIAINILTNEKVFKAGLRRKMRKAAMDRNYLASVLAGSGLS